MTPDQVAFLLLGAWIVHAVVLGVVMQRRGYNGFGWGVLAGALGPLADLLALIRHVPTSVDVQTRAGSPGPGAVDLLVGIDGSSASIDAARDAIEMLGPRLGRLALAAVEPLDGTPEFDAEGKARLDVAVAALGPALQELSVSPNTIVLHGRPASALADHATANDFDLLAIGSRGRGLSRAVLGSVATALVSSSPIPVIVGTPGEATSAEDALSDPDVMLRY
jgi:nucleotide-binding universal stress UspA family protein